MQETHVAPAAATLWKRENLVAGLALVALTAAAWAYTLARARAMGGMSARAGVDSMQAMAPAGMLASVRSIAVFLVGWVVMMVAMMLPAALPLILLYRTIARKQLRPRQAAVGMSLLLLGYLAVWTIAGLPVYAYSLLSETTGPLTAVVPGLLLIAGGVYQFTALKQGCHARCSNPLFFVMHQWRPGVVGAARMGVLHGIDCLGCCVGLMTALVALGMMHVAWMLTASVIIFGEKTLPSGHRVARPLGIALVAGGLVVLGMALRRGVMAM